jgi:hypothetical protein
VSAKPKRAKVKTKETDHDGLWVSPRYSLKGPSGERAWENRPGGPPNSSKYLELADIALGLKTPDSAFKKRKSNEAHVTDKTEPYTR